MFDSDSQSWAKRTFGTVNLDDERRDRRLLKVAADLADNPGKSLVKASKDPAGIEAAYRFIENDYISPKAIAQAGFNATAEEAQKYKTVLAIEDTTGLSYKHSVARELGDNPSSDKSSATTRSLFQHSVLAIDAESETVIGLAHQQNHIREEKVPGTNSERNKRPREEKESYRWEESSQKMDDTFKNTDNVLHICDREADSYEYIDQHLAQGRRFIIRASTNRRLSGPVSYLHTLSECPTVAEHDVRVAQKGNGLVEKNARLIEKSKQGKKLTQKDKKSAKKVNRPARVARVGISYHQVSMKKTSRVKGVTFDEIEVNVVICRELDNPDEDNRLCWYLYTNEPIKSAEDARKIVRYYELRWRIEDYHKVWKSQGTQVEQLRLQTRANTERMCTILAFVAVRLLQLKEMAENQKEAKKKSCELMFTPTEWQMLWFKMEEKQLPETPPSLHWGYYALARLGGWYDSKRTGRVSTKTMWEGWVALIHMLDGHRTMEAYARQKQPGKVLITNAGK